MRVVEAVAGVMVVGVVGVTKRDNNLEVVVVAGVESNFHHLNHKRLCTNNHRSSILD